MGKFMRPHGVGWFLFLIGFLALKVGAAEMDRELEGIRKKIEKERQGIAKVQRREGSILENLESIEAKLEKQNRQLKTVNTKLEALLAELRKTEEEIKTLESSLSQRRALLEKRATALYRWHRGGSPFILLNGSFSAAELMRRKHYLELVLAYDQRLLSDLRSQSARQEALKEELARKREALNRQRRGLAEVKESIRAERERKKEVLASLRREKEAHVSALKELEQAAHRLQKMMDEISRRAVAKPQESSSGAGFEAMRGKLDFPVRGEVIGGFGKTKHPEFSTELFRKGVDIKAPLGEQIKAVERGQVIFADRFSGYGKMIIVDHGQRYYTIYAHLADLLKKTGETVQKGEPIALLGDTDSLVGARLYFEIRKDGRPLDPLAWFKR